MAGSFGGRRGKANGFAGLEPDGCAYGTRTPMMEIHTSRGIRRKARLVLTLGFCALLALVAAIGIYAANTLERLSSGEVSEVARQSARNALLKQADESLTLATRSVRDCLLGLNESQAEPHRALAREAWSRAEEAIRNYRNVARNRAEPAGRLLEELSQYWQLAERTIKLDQEHRRTAATTTFASQLEPLRDRFMATLEELQQLDWEDLRSVAARSEGIAGVAKRKMWAGVGVSCVLALLIVLFTFWNLKRLEESAVASYAKAANAVVELGNLSERLFRSQEDERRRIAREIHDDFGQRMATLLYELSGIAERGDATPEIRAATDSTRQRLSDLANDLQNLSRGLHSAVLDKIGLEGAIRSDCALVVKRTNLEVNFQSARLPRRLPEEIALCVYRVYQEAMQNALKHSNSKRIDVSIALADARLTLDVRDYGIGFDPASLGGHRSLGLVSMRERLRMVGGELAVRPSAPSGTEVEASVPLPVA